MSNMFTEMWNTRPLRLPKSEGGAGLLAGVCEGIGERYRVNPLWFRIAFAVTGLFGPGIFIYLLCLLLMRKPSSPLAPIEAIFASCDPLIRTERNLGIVLLVALIVLGGGFGYLWAPGFFPFYTEQFTPLLIAGVVWMLLHNRQPVPETLRMS
ncbi:MAG: PspC domain-containing protein [Corynebacterium sp.]|nr:PspC domain-containing protein [Corynebacterium sp.]